MKKVTALVTIFSFILLAPSAGILHAEPNSGAALTIGQTHNASFSGQSVEFDYQNPFSDMASWNTFIQYGEEKDEFNVRVSRAYYGFGVRFWGAETLFLGMRTGFYRLSINDGVASSTTFINRFTSGVMFGVETEGGLIIRFDNTQFGAMANQARLGAGFRFH